MLSSTTARPKWRRRRPTCCASWRAHAAGRLFLEEVGPLGRAGVPSATLTQDPLYRRVMSIRAELAG